MEEKLLSLCQNLESITGVSFSPLFPNSCEEFYQQASASRFCQLCPYRQKNEFYTHLYGLNEAYRWDSPFIYYCPKAMTFVAVAIMDSSGNLSCGMIAGPIIMGELLDIAAYAEYPQMRDEIQKVTVMTTQQVRQLSQVMAATASSLSYESFRQKPSYDQQKFLNSIYDMREKYMDEKEHYDYILEAENHLCDLIRKQDRANSQDLINRLLGHIFFYHAGDLADIKARTMELLVVLSRSVIANGADVGEIFRYSTSYFQQIDHCESVDQLSRWLSEIIDQFIAVSFDYQDAKHSDIVYKSMEYIRNNCCGHISLEEVANEVYLSRSYLSSIFKQETGMGISDYINRCRIDHSKMLLSTTNLTLVEVSNECCFGDQSYFSRVFKKYEGVSPKQYRAARKKYT